MKKLLLIMLTPIIFLAISCKKDDDVVEDNGDENATLKTQIVENYANIVYYNYLDAYNTAEDLKKAIDSLVNNPTSTHFEEAKEAWLAAREPYGQTEAFRFSSGPIDDVDGPEGLLNAWPLDENYIDYVDGASTSGIVNNTTDYPSISKTLLESLNESGGEKNISIGYHAIEFLLWGQDESTPSDKLAGQRPYTDFVDGGTASNQDRRRQYLQICTELLLEHLQLMVDEWDPNSNGNYRSTFLALDEDVAIKNILTGIGVLSKSELAGERIFTAYDNQDQEDEHSCFSDNTDRDIRLNAEGIRNVYLGCYERTDGLTKITGSSISDLVNVVDADFAEEVIISMNSAMTETAATASPFDFAISDATERPQVLSSVTALQSFGDKIAEVGTKLGVTINTALPD